MMNTFRPVDQNTPALRRQRQTCHLHNELPSVFITKASVYILFSVEVLLLYFAQCTLVVFIVERVLGLVVRTLATVAQTRQMRAVCVSFLSLVSPFCSRLKHFGNNIVHLSMAEQSIMCRMKTPRLHYTFWLDIQLELANFPNMTRPIILTTRCANRVSIRNNHALPFEFMPR
jgi:hypothetical protein